MSSKTYKLINVLGLHTRASAKLVDCACSYQADVCVIYGKKTANAKRIMEVLILGAKCGDAIELSAQGADASEALLACGNLISDGFGE